MKLEYGKLISEELSQILRDNVSNHEITKYVMRKDGKPSFSAIEKVLYRRRVITDLTDPAIMHLCQVAFENIYKKKVSCKSQMSWLSKHFGFKLNKEAA